MARSAPGKHYREGISLLELTAMFPDEASAVAWFEGVRWAEGRRCPRCGFDTTAETPNRRPMPYRCSGCKTYFSVRTGTVLAHSRLPMRKWMFAIYLVLTNLKGVSSMKLHRDLGVTQKTAWFMLHRIREAWAHSAGEPFAGPVEADETYVGGKAKNMHAVQRAKLTGRGGVDKAVVVGIKDRATNRVVAGPVADTSARTLVAAVADVTEHGATVFTDEHRSYKPLASLGFAHEAVAHSAHEFVRGPVHTNGIESLRSMFKRGYVGTYHHMSEAHLGRYVNEFTGRHNVREMGTEAQMVSVVAGMVGKRLTYDALVSA